MNKDQVGQRTVSLLVNIYEDYQSSGRMPEDKLKYFNGFVDASLMLAAYSPERLDDLIDEANLAAFGMTLLERKKSVEYRDNPEQFDAPAYTRNMKASDVLKKKGA